jgi:2-oxoglutarate dehydrogenase complex dehydrogenase (E1) component-like enzyme
MAKNRVKKPAKFDGLNEADKRNIRRVLRQAWSWSYSRRLVVKRCTLPNGFSRCEKCKKRVARVTVDHIARCGEVDQGNFIKRLFVASNKMQGLCDDCHKTKTREERIKSKLDKDFY